LIHRRGVVSVGRIGCVQMQIGQTAQSANTVCIQIHVSDGSII
jgi:hypothetical protein